MPPKAFAAIGGTTIMGNPEASISPPAIELSIFPVQNCIKQKHEGDEKQFEDGPPERVRYNSSVGCGYACVLGEGVRGRYPQRLDRRNANQLLEYVGRFWQQGRT